MSTYIVIGAAKTGTSMVAGSLRILGINMGEDLGKWDNYSEDLEMISALERNDGTLFEHFCGVRNKKFDRWGFKHPDLLTHFDRIKGACRDPHFIFVFRDPYATALRRRDNSDACTQKSNRMRGEVIIKLAEQYEKMARLMCSETVPILPISYEKALMFPNRFALNMVRFTKTPITSTAVKRIEAYIKPEAMYPKIGTYL